METLTQDELKRTLRVTEIPDALLYALKVKATTERRTMREIVIEALQNSTGTTNGNAPA